jgi:predicted metal-dependent enzyme (double-stranded beta helix superfamily)
MFDRDALLVKCQACVAETDPRRAITEVLREALSRPDDVADAFDPTEGGIEVLHNASDLTVLHVVWAPHMQLYPHDHRMWAAIGIYAGQEDNAFFRRVNDERRTLAESGGKQLVTGDVLVLGDDTVHAVTNPRDHLTGAIHVYGGDFARTPRSQWGPGPREERPYDLAETMQQFADANVAWRSGRP